MKQGLTALLTLVIAAVIVLLVSWAHADAATILANGDTPAQRYQRVADRAHVPTWDGTIALHAGACAGVQPAIAKGWMACYVPGDVPRIYMKRKLRMGGIPARVYSRMVFLHELGHAYAEHVLTDDDRAAIQRLWGHDYWDEEVFAEAYSACGMFPRPKARHARWNLAIAYDFWDEHLPALAATCRLLRGRP